VAILVRTVVRTLVRTRVRTLVRTLVRILVRTLVRHLYARSYAHLYARSYAHLYAHSHAHTSVRMNVHAALPRACCLWQRVDVDRGSHRMRSRISSGRAAQYITSSTSSTGGVRQSAGAGSLQKRGPSHSQTMLHSFPVCTILNSQSTTSS